MLITKELVTKSTLALATTATTVTLGVVYKDNIASLFTEDEITKFNEKIKSLGIKDCKLAKGSSGVDCTLDSEKLKLVNFLNKAPNNPTVTGLNSSSTITLRIEKTNDDMFSENLKFIFKPTADVTVSAADTANSISLKSGTNPEFKINTGGKLERAWNLEKLAAKVDLVCDTDKKCSLKSGGRINVIDGDNKVIGATITETKKISVTEGQVDYNQGFKFIVETADITLNEGVRDSGNTEPASLKVNTASGNPTYQIKYQNDNWFLVKK